MITSDQMIYGRDTYGYQGSKTMIDSRQDEGYAGSSVE